eukprot:3906522-Prymnesium_polylepis.1
MPAQVNERTEDEEPSLGAGWQRITVRRPEGQAKREDHYFLSPDGVRFRSYCRAQAYAEGAPLDEVAENGKEFGKRHAANARRSPGGAVDQIMCTACGDGNDIPGNEILLCDGRGCRSAYHLACLPGSLYDVPEGDWFCPACKALGNDAEPRPQQECRRRTSAPDDDEPPVRGYPAGAIMSPQRAAAAAAANHLAARLASSARCLQP